MVRAVASSCHAGGIKSRGTSRGVIMRCSGVLLGNIAGKDGSAGIEVYTPAPLKASRRVAGGSASAAAAAGGDAQVAGESRSFASEPWPL